MSKSKKLIFMVIGVLILVAAVIGVIKYNEYQASLEPEESSSSVVLKNLIENDKANIASINLKTKSDSITLVPGGTSASDGSIQWVLEGHEDWTLKNTYSSIVSMAALFQVYKEIETDVTDQKRLGDFGLADPSSVVTITLKDGTVQTVLIGDLSSDKTFTFCMMVGDNTVYACNATYNGYATFTRQNIRLAVIDNQIDTENELKSLFVQKKGEKAVEFVYDAASAEVAQTDSSSVLTSSYKFVQPYTARHIRVRQDILENYFNNLMTPTVIETVDAECTDFDQYGLGDDPEYRETIVMISSIDGSEIKTDYLFGYTYGANDAYIYFREAGSNMVLGVDATCMDVREFTPFYYVNKLVYLNSISNIVSGTITCGEETHEFSVKRQEVVQEDSSGSEEPLAVYRLDGELIDTDTFLSLYRAMISVAPDYEISGETPEYDESDKLEFQVNYNDGTQDTISFYRMSEFYYVTQADDDIWFACSDSHIENVAEKLAACLDAE